MNRTNDEKLDLFCDLIEPAAKIIQDKTWALAWQAGDRAAAVKAAIGNHKAEVVEILARIDGQDPASYQINGLALIVKLSELLKQLDMDEAKSLFTSQDQSAGGAASGPAMDAIQGGAL